MERRSRRLGSCALHVCVSDNLQRRNRRQGSRHGLDGLAVYNKEKGKPQTQSEQKIHSHTHAKMAVATTNKRALRQILILKLKSTNLPMKSKSNNCPFKSERKKIYCMCCTRCQPHRKQGLFFIKGTTKERVNGTQLGTQNINSPPEEDTPAQCHVRQRPW